MAKLTLTDVLTLDASAITAINANSTATETALENTLSRDGTTPNTMSASLDMNSNRILNLPAPASTTEPARLADLNAVQGIGGNVASFNGRVGIVTPAANDYAFSQLSGSIASSQIPSDAVTTAKILDANVTTAKIADVNVTTGKIANDAVTYAKVQNVSATDKVLGRSTAGAGDIEEIACTSSGRAILDDASNREQCRTLAAPYRLGGSAVAASVTGTTTETTLATVQVPANAMGANGSFRLTCQFSYTNSANNKTLRLKFGGTTLHSLVLTTTALATFDIFVQNRNVTNSQYSMGLAGATSAASVTATAAIDTTASADILITGQLANAGETITLESYIVTLIGT